MSFPPLHTRHGALIDECALNHGPHCGAYHPITVFWGGRRGYAVVEGHREDATALASAAGYTHWAHQTCVCDTSCPPGCDGSCDADTMDTETAYAPPTAWTAPGGA